MLCGGSECRSGQPGGIKTTALLTAIFIWLLWTLGGLYYVPYYAADKKVILAGPMPSVHNFFMETKEHIFFMLLLLATYLPIAARAKDLLANKTSRNLVLTVAGLVVILALIMDGSGALLAVVKETTGLLKAMAGVTGHHWTTHGIVVMLLFFILGFIFSGMQPQDKPWLEAKGAAKGTIVAAIIGYLIIVGFYLFVG